MVARLKLKEIDGRAPPGVNALQTPPLKAASTEVRWLVLTAESSETYMLVAFYRRRHPQIAGNS
jgi:hypothetical protein